MTVVKGIVVVACLTAGSSMLMWIGERITENGVGNGISIVLMINIVSRIPNDLVSLFQTFVQGKTIARGALAALIIAAIIILVVVLVLNLKRRYPQDPGSVFQEKWWEEKLWAVSPVLFH